MKLYHEVTMNKFFIYYRYNDEYLSDIVDGLSAEEVQARLEFEWGYVVKIIFVEPLSEVEHQCIRADNGLRYFVLQ